MRVAVIGSQSLKLDDLSAYLPDETTELISDGTTGIAAAAERYACRNHIPRLILRPAYEKYGDSAPLVRNRQIVRVADLVVALWDGESSGTKATIDYAKKLGVPVQLHIISSRK